MKHVITGEFRHDGILYLMSVNKWDSQYVREINRAKVFDDWYEASRFIAKHELVLSAEPKLHSFTNKEYFKLVLEGK